MIVGQGTWCAEQLFGARTWRRVRVLGKRAGRFAFGPVSEVEDIQAACRGTVHLSFTPSQLFLLRQAFQTTRSELLDLQIQQDFVEQGLALEGVDFLHRKKLLASTGGTNHYMSTFVPEAEIGSLYLQAGTWRGIRRLRILPGAVALAGLFRLVTEDPVLILLLDPNKYQLVVVRDGIPLYNQRLAANAAGGIDEDLVPHAFEFAAQFLKRDFEISAYRFTCLGPEREGFDPSLVPGLKPWQPDFGEVMVAENPGEILSYPQLFGGVVADDAFNFTPVEFSRSWRLQGLAVLAAGLAGVAALGLFSGWYLLQDDLGRLRADYARLYRSVADQRAALSRILPREEQFRAIDRLITIRSRAFHELRLDRLVADIARSLAGEVQVTTLQVVRQAQEAAGATLPPPDTENLPVGGVPPVAGPGSAAAPAGTTPAGSPAEQLQARPLKVELACVTSGSYDVAATRIQNTIAALSRVFAMENVLWRYVEKERRGYLSCELAPLTTANKEEQNKQVPRDQVPDRGGERPGS